MDFCEGQQQESEDSAYGLTDILLINNCLVDRLLVDHLIYNLFEPFQSLSGGVRSNL